jgi:hypothetical protein
VDWILVAYRNPVMFSCEKYTSIRDCLELGGKIMLLHSKDVGFNVFMVVYIKFIIF